MLEVGPIRPPSEAGSLLLRITRNCSWNKCRFCALYRGQKFSMRSIDEIKAEIDQVAACMEAVPESVFLQDANTLVLTYDKLREILVYLREKLPQIKRVTSYGRVDSLMKFSSEQLAGLKEAGLDRIHSGYESGSDRVLALLNKGHTKDMEIEAGQNVMASGIELSVYFMPGAGGKALSGENAAETADVVNKVNPDFVRIRTFVAKHGTEVFDDIESGVVAECTDVEKMLELKRMINGIEGAKGRLYSDHIVNLFEDVNGSMSEDKAAMLGVFEEFEKLGRREQMRYQLARRMGMVGSLRQMGLLDTEGQDRIDAYLGQVESEAVFEESLLWLLRHYI